MQPLFDKRKRFFEVIIFRSWWVILFILITLFVYEQAIHRKKNEYAQLELKKAALLKEKQRALQQQELLKANIVSQQDAAWIEMTLINKLGLVPEGEVKILFTPQAPHSKADHSSDAPLQK